MLEASERADARARIAVRVVATALRIPGAEGHPLEALLASIRARSPEAFAALLEYAESSTLAALSSGASEFEVARARGRERVALSSLVRLLR